MDELLDIAREGARVLMGLLPGKLTLDLGGGVTMEFVLIPAGEFMMGSAQSPEEVARQGGGKPEWFENEHPRHRVRISKPFYMGKYEVTQAQWEAVMGAHPSQFKGDNRPVEQVSWDDCREFCQKLSRKTGHSIRLPSEAEWEYACRAGTTTAFTYGDSLSSSQANFDGNDPYGGATKGVYRKETTSVGSFASNDFGLYDMHGNVWEWCNDWYDTYPSGAQVDPAGPSSGSGRVLRGGSWYNNADFCRSAIHFRSPPVNRDRSGGFRVAAGTLSSGPREPSRFDNVKIDGRNLVVTVIASGANDLRLLQDARDKARALYAAYARQELNSLKSTAELREFARDNEIEADGNLQPGTNRRFVFTFPFPPIS